MSLAITEFRRPPGPEEPVSIGVDAETLARLAALGSEYGSVVQVTKPNGRDAIFVNDAAEVRKLLVRHHPRYHKGPGFERVKMLLGNGLIVSDGAIWRRSRTMIQPAFSRQNVHRLIGLMVECCGQRRESWRKAAEAGQDLNITQEMSEFALELILRAIFGADYERRIIIDGRNRFAFLSEDSTRDLRVVMQVRELRQLLLDVIAERRQAEPGEQYDFLSMYLTTTDKSGNGFSDDELLDELMTLIIAGYETSAGTLNWAWYLLAGHSDAEETLVQEARSKISAPQDVNVETLSELTYAQQFLEETLRLYPPVWIFSRRSNQDDSLDSFDLHAGTDIYLSPYLLHRNEEYWPDAEKFDPERFGPESPYKKGDRPYFPFSLGPRRCLGEYFSFLEMKIHLGLLAQEFRMQRVGSEVPGLDLGINLRSLDDIMLRPTLRDSA